MQDYALDVKYGIIGQVLRCMSVEQSTFQNLATQDITIGNGNVTMWGNLSGSVDVGVTNFFKPVKFLMNDEISYLTTTPSTIIEARDTADVAPDVIKTLPKYEHFR